MLILAAITINLTVGQRGIITRAQEAGKNYQEAAKREDEELANLWAEAENIIKGNGNGGGTTPTPPDGGDDKDPITPTEPEPSEEVKALKAGDYIKYDTGVEGIGVITCRVLYPVDSEYGLQIISNKNVGPNIKLGGSTWEEAKTSYNGAIRTLNDEAQKYVNSEYAYDGRCMGSIPTVRNGIFVDKNRVIDIEGNIRDERDTYSIPESWTVPVGWSSRDTGVYVGGDENYLIDRTAAIACEIWNTEQEFWMASRCLTNATDKESSCSFSLWRKVPLGALQNGTVCTVKRDRYTGCDRFR